MGETNQLNEQIGWMMLPYVPLVRQAQDDAH